VTGRRHDGYHLLDSLAVFAELADTLAAAPAPALSLTVTGPFADAAGVGDDNLVLRAARALAPGRAAALTLDKRIPVAAGLGGGSADAAATLRLLSRLWHIPIGCNPLALGADVPVCLASAPARMQGIGEVLVAAPALPPGLGLVIANPRLPLATPAVFAARAGAFDAPATLPASFADAATLAAWLATTTNGLEAAATTLCPPIAAVRAACAALPGALFARMSGSGPTCFALFASVAAAEAGAAHLAQAEPAWFSWGGGLYRNGPLSL
jgi:4-diphosphocytidyl-2-C-methyl-D-erythritol kinase